MSVIIQRVWVGIVVSVLSVACGTTTPKKKTKVVAPASKELREELGDN